MYFEEHLLYTVYIYQVWSQLHKAFIEEKGGKWGDVIPKLTRSNMFIYSTKMKFRIGSEIGSSKYQSYDEFRCLFTDCLCKPNISRKI